jgi:hypothetical protein
MHPKPAGALSPLWASGYGEDVGVAIDSAALPVWEDRSPNTYFGDNGVASGGS